MLSAVNSADRSLSYLDWFKPRDSKCLHNGPSVKAQEGQSVSDIDGLSLNIGLVNPQQTPTFNEPYPSTQEEGETDDSLSIMPIPVKLSLYERLFINEYDIGKQLGLGAASSVYLARKKETGKRYVLKETQQNRRGAFKQATNEVNYLQRLSHPSIINYIGHFNGSILFFTILESFSNQDLFNCIGKLSYKEIRSVAAQMILALGYLFEQRVLHRDIKPENILINRHGRIKLIDFGFAKELEEGQKARTALGTAPYTCPEILANEAYDFPSEIWSTGVTLHLVFFNCYPFEQDKYSNTIDLLKYLRQRIQDNPSLSVKRGSYHPDYIRIIRLISCCLKWNPLARASIGQLKEHEIFQEHSIKVKKPVALRKKTLMDLPAINWDRVYS